MTTFDVFYFVATFWNLTNKKIVTLQCQYAPAPGHAVQQLQKKYPCLNKIKNEWKHEGC